MACVGSGLPARDRATCEIVSAVTKGTWHSAAALLACCAASSFVSPISAPVVSRISPNNVSAQGGGTVKISGEGFTSGSTVSFGSAPATTVRVVSPDSILASAPPGSGAVDVRVSSPEGVSAATPYDRLAYDPPPQGDWLGLNGDSLNFLGPITRFSRARITFDREEIMAGQPPNVDEALHRAIDHGMTPDVVIEYDGYTGEHWGTPDKRFPRGAGIARYVEGFLSTASAIRRLYPHRRILFEPINEPYGYASAAQYAAVVAALLPAAQRAGLPLEDIYVAARGSEWVPHMYAAQPSLQTAVQGWNFHPYGPPSGVRDEYTEGVQSVPYVQAQMTSGQSNIIISEIGWCALDVNHGSTCGGPYLKSGQLAAQALTTALQNALAMRRAGWLRALIVYSRSYGGWAMQLSNGVLTEQGRALLRFAQQHPEM